MESDFNFLDSNTSNMMTQPMVAKSNAELFTGEPAKDNFFTSLVDNPNFIQALATAGSALDPTGVGGAFGKAAKGWSKNKAIQTASAKQKNKQRSQMDYLIKSLQGEFGNTLVGDPNDMNTANKITIDPKGINVNYPNKSPEAKFSFGTDQALEGIKNITVPEEPNMIPDFSSLTKDDLRGLGPDEIAMLLSDDKRSQSILDKIYQQKVGELKYGRDTILNKQKSLDAKNKLSVENAFEREMANLDTENKMKLEKFKSELPHQGTTSDEIALMRARIAEMGLGLQREKQDYTVQKDTKKETRQTKQDKRKLEQEKQSEAEFILDPETKPEQAESAANTFNQGENNRVLYKESHILGDKMREFRIPSDLTYKGIPMTSKDISNLAEKSGLTMEETLQKIMENYNKAKGIE